MDELNKNERQKGYGPAASLGIVCGGIAIAIVALLILQNYFCNNSPARSYFLPGFT